MTKSPTVLLALSDARTRHEIGASLAKFSVESIGVTNSEEAMSVLTSDRRIGVVVVDADARDGLQLAHEARTVRPGMAVVYSAEAPQKIPEGAMVKGAPVLRTPYTGHLLAGVIANLGRAVVHDPRPI